jgi:integrase
MHRRRIAQTHLEYRPSGFHWRRRWPARTLARAPGERPKFLFLLFPLRTHVLSDAKTLARRLTLLSDETFAAAAERTMPIAPVDMEQLLTELCRFEIEVADLARETAPSRSPETAAFEEACAAAALATLREAIRLRDREIVRAPLQAVAARLGLVLDESDPDWARLAMQAMRALLEAREENLRRDRGEFGPRPVFVHRALACLEPETVDVSPVPPQPLAHHRPASVRVPPVAMPLTTLPSWPPAAIAAGPALAAAPTPHEPVASDARPAAHGPASSCSILEGAEVYIDLRCKGHKTFKPNENPCAASGQSWKRNSSNNVRSTARILSGLLGIGPVRGLGDAELKEAWALIERLPANYGRSPKERLTPREAIEKADREEAQRIERIRSELHEQKASPGRIEAALRAARVPRMRVATIYRHMQDFQRMCRFWVRRGWLDDNIMADHIWSSDELQRRNHLEEDNTREIWTPEQLGALFRTPKFTEVLEDPGDPMFWAPVISTHSGMRSEEILQLAIDDVQEIDGIACFVLRQGPGQTLKSEAARRKIPVHENLIALGFLELVALRRREGEPRLFPWLERSAAKETLTETFSKAYTRYRKDHGIYDPQRDFHSHRTTFNDALVEAECPDTQRRYMIGHVERDVGIVHYKPGKFSMRLLKKRVDAVRIDISMIRRPFQPSATPNVTFLEPRRAARPRA